MGDFLRLLGQLPQVSPVSTSAQETSAWSILIRCLNYMVLVNVEEQLDQSEPLPDFQTSNLRN